MPKPVLTKEDFVKRFQQGEFGNRSPMWSSLKEYFANPLEHKYDLLHLRNRVKGGPTWFNIPYDKVGESAKTAISKGLVRESDLYVAAMCPTEKTTFQGEVRQTEEGLYIYGSRVAKPMRESLKEGGEHYFRLHAVGMLLTYMDQNSREWLEHLLHSYPDHVIEFTCLSQCWGIEPGYNTLFWEVRFY